LNKRTIHNTLWGKDVKKTPVDDTERALQKEVTLRTYHQHFVKEGGEEKSALEAIDRQPTQAQLLGKW